MTLRLAGRGGEAATVALDTGHICDLRLNGIAPLHRAPWLDEAEVQDDPSIPLVERRLQGDFFCAPFGKSDLIDAPIHGMSANSPWDLIAETGDAAHLRLCAPVMGARIDKHIALRGGALFQTHRISGGVGALPVAHHPMVRMAAGGRLSFSPKAGIVTQDAPLEVGRNWLQYPAEGRDARSFPGADGPVDLTAYPEESGHEDFVTLIEAPGVRLGWTAIARKAERDLIVIAKDPRSLPVTMLWFSNGGRDYSPWNGRHIGVLGVEDGCTAGAAGHRAAAAVNAISAYSVRTALTLRDGDTHETRHAIYAVELHDATALVMDVFVQEQSLCARFEDGTERRLGPAPDWVLHPHPANS
ncbi:MAG: hypothetical protein AAGK92_05125 [Pseudomonadota bacterium]